MVSVTAGLSAVVVGAASVVGGRVDVVASVAAEDSAVGGCADGPASDMSSVLIVGCEDEEMIVLRGEKRRGEGEGRTGCKATQRVRTLKQQHGLVRVPRFTRVALQASQHLLRRAGDMEMTIDVGFWQLIYDPPGSMSDTTCQEY